MIVTVEVTQRDIEKGRGNNVLCCPVALALRRATGRGWTVGHSSVSPWRSKNGFGLPRRVVEIIDELDDGGTIEPFSFSLDIPDELTRP